MIKKLTINRLHKNEHCEILNLFQIEPMVIKINFLIFNPNKNPPQFFFFLKIMMKNCRSVEHRQGSDLI